MDIPHVLPSVFLDCVNVPMDSLPELMAKTAGSSESDLLTSDLLIYVQGWQRLLEATFTRIFAFSRGRPMGCTSWTDCGVTKHEWLNKRLAFSKQGWMPFAVKVDWNQFRVCEKCRICAKSSYETARQEVWTDLPSYFNLPPWEDLLRKDSEEDDGAE
jgi:hypothetical protein